MKPLRPGDVAPDFALPDQDSTPVRLSDLLRAGPVVLFFYPAANSSGCTAEVCHFRDLADDFAAAGAQLVGVSADPVADQRRFAERNGFDFPVLSDREGRVATSYGVRRGLLARIVPVKRVTFVVGRDGHVASVVASETRMTSHADRALTAVGALAPPPGV